MIRGACDSTFIDGGMVRVLLGVLGCVPGCAFVFVLFCISGCVFGCVYVYPHFLTSPILASGCQSEEKVLSGRQEAVFVILLKVTSSSIFHNHLVALVAWVLFSLVVWDYFFLSVVCGQRVPCIINRFTNTRYSVRGQITIITPRILLRTYVSVFQVETLVIINIAVSAGGAGARWNERRREKRMRETGTREGGKNSSDLATPFFSAYHAENGRVTPDIGR